MHSNFSARFYHRKAAGALLARISCAALLSAGLFATSPASAHGDTKARLVACAEQSCLRIEGHRESAGMMVAINGTPMAVDGTENWSVTLPMGTVRQLAEHGARRLEVTLLHPASRRETRDYARLPIGLLGDTTDLEAIRVTVS